MSAAIIAGTAARAGRPRAPTIRVNLPWAFAGNAAYAASQWGMLIALAKLGSPAMLGRFALGLAIAAPAMIFANLALRPIQATDARGRFAFGDYLGLRLATTALALAVIAGLAFATARDRATLLTILAVGLAKGVESISDVFHGLLQRHERMDRVATSLLLKGPLSLAALAAGVRLTGAVHWGALALAGSWAAVLVGYDLRAAAATGARLRPRWAGRTPWRLAWLALPLGLAMMLGSLNANIPRYAVARSVGAGGLGRFVAIAYLTVAGNSVIAALGQAAGPRLARFYAAGDAAGFRALLARLLAAGLLMGAAGILAAALGGPALLAAIYRPDYARDSGVFLLVMVAAALDYAGSLLGYGLTAAGAFRIQPLLFGALAALNAALAFSLVPRLGAAGAAAAMIVVAAAQAAASLACLLHRLRNPGGDAPEERRP